MIELLYIGLKFVIGAVIAIASILAGVRVFDFLTRGIEEWKEMKEGNLAVSIYMGSVIFTIALIVESLVFTSQLNLAEIKSFTTLLFSVITDIVYAVLGAIIGAVTIYIALRILDNITTDVDEFEEIKRGNVAVAIFVAIIIITLGFLIRSISLEVIESLNLLNLIIT